MKKQSGFTLIELIMVIVILGILAAVALPRFVNLGSDARIAAMKAVEGSMRSANAIIYAKAAVGNLMTGTTASAVNVSVNEANIATAYGFATSVTELVEAMDINTTTGDFEIVSNQIQHKGAGNPASCVVAYSPATSLTVSPTYILTDAGC